MESLSNQFSVISLVLGHKKVDPGRQFKNDGALPVGQGQVSDGVQNSRWLGG
jgi:hypothetical protein